MGTQQLSEERRETMKRFAALGLILLLAGGLAYGKDFEVKKKAGDYAVEMKIDRNPPVVGDNNMTIELKDGSGKHVTDAKVVVHYGMPAMPGMPPMNYKTDASLDGNKYKALMKLSMSGSWNIDVKISRGGKTETAKFNIDAK
jgi:hypothetical protein